MHQRTVRRAAAAGLACVLVLAALFAFHDAAVAAVVRGVAAMLGYQVAFDRLSSGFTRATLLGVRVAGRNGEPLFKAERIEAQYVLRDLLPGGRHLFGLSVIDVSRPQLTLIHRADGTYNITLPSTNSSTRTSAPLDLQARVRDGSIVLIDRFIVPGHERRQRIVGLAADVALAPGRRSSYTVRFDLDDGRIIHPVLGKAVFDDARGFESQHWTAALLPVGPLVDFALSSHAIDLVDGDLRNVDARIGAIVDPSGKRHTVLAARASLERGKVYVAGMNAPIRDARGPLVVYDDGITTIGVDASLAGTPLHISGGVYGWGAPQVQFVVNGGGRLALLRHIAVATDRKPLAGQLTFAVRAAGPLTQPLVTGRFQAPSVIYGDYRFTQASGTIAVSGRELQILDARAGYGPLALVGRGVLQLDREVATNAIVTVAGTGDSLPYAAQIVPGLHLGAAVHVQGTGQKLAAAGVVYGAGPHGRLDALFSLDPNGTGTLGPISIQRSDGASIYARVALDRTAGNGSGIVDIHHFSLLHAHLANLPGVRTTTLPSLAGTLDARGAGVVEGGRLVAGGASVHVNSSLGRLDGAGSAADGTYAFTGRLISSFERLHALGVDAGARGAIDAPVSVIGDADALAVQVPHLGFQHASLRGIALHDGSATIVKRGNGYEVRAARLGIAGGSVTAQGRFGDGGEVQVTTSGLDLRGLAALGIPLDRGRLTAIARIGGTFAAPRVRAGVLVADAAYRGVPVAGSALAHYDHAVLTVRDVAALIAGANVTGSGTVSGLGGRPAPSLDVRAAVSGAQIAMLARAAQAPLRYPDGEIDADLHATGPANAPQLDGDVRIARGSLNGMAFSDARAGVHGNIAGLTAEGGHVTVGSTVVAFSGAFSRAAMQLALRAPHADLADFDTYTTGSDALVGTGRVAIDAAVSPTSVGTTGDVALTGVRLRQIPVGDVAAAWHTTGRTVTANASVQGARGSATVAGAVTFPAAQPLRDPQHRTALVADAQIAGLDLGAWLATANVFVPVTGTIDGKAHVNGAPATPAFTANASLQNGAVAKIPIQMLTVAASGDRTQLRIDDLRLSTAGVTASATGTAGYGAHDPIAFAIQAQAADLKQFVTAAGLHVPIAGSASTTAHVSGTRSTPQIAQLLDAVNLTVAGYRIPHVHADIVSDATTATLRSAEVDLQKGRVFLTAALPIAQLDGPLTGTFRADSIDLAQFNALMPKGTRGTGILNGTLTAGGTRLAPSLGGDLALTNVGGGRIDTTLTAALADVHDPRGTLSFDAHATAAHAGINVANITAKIDGTLQASQTRGGIPLLGGDLTVSQGRIPLNELLPPRKAAAAASPFPLAFNLGVTVGSDVRVQSPNVDIGARGQIAVAGTLAKPELRGKLRSTDGTLSFYRTFALERGTVAFDPSSGIEPDVDATATTHITDPDTEVLLHVHGPATRLTLDLESRPGYDKSQILGLLVNAQAFGAVPGIATANTAGSGPSIVGLAGNALSQQFTRNLLQPLGGGLSRALGLQDVALGYDFTGGFTADLSRKLGKHVTVSVNQSFGADQRETLAFEDHLGNASSLQLTVFNAGSPPTLGTTLPIAPNGPENFTLTALSPPAGSSGFIVTYQRKYK